jgi:hypothetical protein
MGNNIPGNNLSKLTGGATSQPAKGNLANLIQQNQQSVKLAQEQTSAPYPHPAQTLDDQISSMPNSDKLSGFERFVYKVLPGVSASPIGKLLESFGKTWVGKQLNKLDILAEGTERTLGTLAQLRYGDENAGMDWADAWKAGSLYYDVSNMPTLTGNGFELESDLPGTYALVEARKMMEQGATLDEVRDTLYNNLGALKLRSQLQDTMGHVALDPLNYVGAFVKPVEKLTAMRNLAMSGKIDVAAANKIAESLRAAGKVDDALKVENAIADAEKTGKAMTFMDKATINLFGGAGYLDEDASKLQKFFGSKYNPLALTPEAKTHELMDMAEKNVTAYLINNSKNPEEFIQNMEAIAKGSVGKEWGHIALTPQGRAVQGIFNNADASVKALGQEWKLYGEERAALETVSDALKMDANEVWKLARENPQELGNMIARASQEGLLQVTDPKVIQAISDIPASSVTAEKFFTHAAAQIEDAAAQIGILKFGVDKKKLITRLSDAVKKYETMAFIKLNPANMARNWINNEVTMIARGLFGIPLDTAKAYWADKYLPEMFKRAFNVAGDGVDNEMDLAQKTLSAAVNGTGNRDWIGKAGSIADDIDLGVADMSKWSQKAEASASLRASTNAYIQFGRDYWNPKTGFTSISKYLDPDTLDQIAAVDANLARTLDDVAEASGGDIKKFRELMATQLETNSASVFKAAEDNLGFKIGDVLGPEISQQVAEGLPQAVRDGKVTEFMNGLRTQMENHVDELFNKNVENLPQIVSNYVQAGGSPQFSRMYSKVMDEFWAGNTEHAIRMSTINELIDSAKASGDYKKVNSLWNKIFQDGENHFGRLWKKMDAYEAGMKEGAKAAGLPYPPELSNGFSGMKKGWQDFFTMRNTEYEKFFASELKGQEATNAFNELTNKLNKSYEAMINKEDSLYGAIDNSLSKMIPDKEVRKMYQRMRKQAGELRVADRQATQRFYEVLRNTDSSEYPGMWQKFWQDRQARITEMRDLERRGSAMMQGDQQAINQFSAGADQTVDPNSVRGIASQYGLATQTASGAPMDNQILNTIKKYGEYTDRQIVENAKLPQEVKTAYGNWDDANNALKNAPAGASLDETKALKDAEKTARLAYEESLKTANVDKKMVQKLTKNREFMDVNTIPADVVKNALEKRAAAKGASVKEAVDKYFMPDVEMIWPEPMPIETAISELNYGRSYAAMDTIAEEAMAQAQVKSHKLADLPEELQAKVMKWGDNVQAESTGFRSAQFEYAKMRRDSALLNYNRRNNFDNFVGHLAPFAFWTTHSMANWAIHSIDRPAMYTSYLRYQKLLQTAGLDNENLPTRMKGHLRIDLPFTPSWMGEQFFNPVGVALPFDAWQQPWQQMQQNQVGTQRRVEWTLQDMLEKNVISEQEYNDAIQNKSGEAYDQALAKAQEGGDNYDAMDFASTMMTPHAPLLWAYNAARGTPNEIGPFTPLSKTARNVATMMGVKDWANSPYNIEGKIRKELGLPAFDKWDDYRVSREISNIAADGDYNMTDIKQAMELAAQVEAGQITSKEAVAKSKAYEEATYRANQEATGGWLGTVLGALGIPIKSLPTGETEQRKLQDEFSKAMEAKNNGDDKAVTDFFDKHPEYEARLSLFKKPEERLKNFMVDNMWSRWNELPKVQQDEVKDQLGASFADKFLNKDTRSYDTITPQQLQIWLKLTGGKNVGQLSATEDAMLELNQLKLTDPETAWRVQTFYDARNENTPDWYEMQQDYYALPEGAQRKAFLKDNPELKQYWTDRQKWMQNNPDLVKYLTDDPKQLKKYENRQRNPQVAVPTAQELQSNVSPENMELLSQWKSGQTLPYATEQTLNQLAQQYNMSTKELLNILVGQ